MSGDKISEFIKEPNCANKTFWWLIHTMAKNATTDDDKRLFANFMMFMQNNHFCPNCREHLGDFIARYPFGNFWKITNPKGEDVGMFNWSWLCHNNVNTLTNKPLLSYQDAYDLFYTQGKYACTHCNESTTSTTSTTTKSSTTTSSTARTINRPTNIIIKMLSDKLFVKPQQ